MKEMTIMCKKLVFLSVALLVAASTLTNAATQGPVGWWKFDETSGTTAVDSAGGRNGTLLPANASPAAAWVAGKLGGAIQFGRAAGAANNAATNPYVELPIGDLLGTLGDTTFSLWVNWGGNTYGDWQRILDFGAGTTVYAFLAANRAGTASSRFAIRNIAVGEQTVTATTSLPIGGWRHIAVGINRTTMRNWLYVDGVAVANAATTLLPKDMVPPEGQPWQAWVARSQYPADAYYVGMVDDLRIYDRFLSADDVTNLMSGGTGFGVANTPTPANLATEVLKTQTLSWTAGATAVKHNVYFGADASSLKSVASGQTATTYTPAAMDFGKTYYWRVDEVAKDGTVITGNVWSFTTELLAYKITAVTPSASSQTVGSEPNKTTDGSGLDASDLHGTNPKTMWATAANPTAPVWVQYDFDKIYKIYELWVWNYNSEFESMLGYGLKDVTIEYATDGKTWTKLGDFQFAQADSAEGYAHNTTVSFNGVAAKNVKITAKNTWGDMGTYGLSEVRFYSTPAYASVPSPANNATGVRPDITLTWRPGRTATQHKVFFSTSQAEVTAGTVIPTNVTTTSFTPADLQLDGTVYYWRVDEVNPAEKVKIWPGDVWKFTTATYLTVDDMESYTNDAEIGKAIYQSWIDGYNSSSNGSQVGYRVAPFAERTYARSGVQAMPFFYTNTKSEPISEATYTFATPQNWAIGGLQTLVLFFRPDVNNVGGKLYVKINGVKAEYAGALTVTSPAPLWEQWNVNLADMTELVGSLDAVKTLTIGVSGLGKGVLYVDDIRLYRTLADVMPRDPGTSNLVSYFNMEGGKVADSLSGTTGNLNGTTFVDSATGLGKALMCTGGTAALNTQYVDLGADYWTKVVSKLSSSTFSVWVNYTGQGSVWSRVFDFGAGSNVNTWITTSAGTAGIVRFCVKTNVPVTGSTSTAYTETSSSGPKALAVGWHHIAGVIDATGNPVQYLYIDGSLASGPNVSRLPKDMAVQTTPWQMWIGRSQYGSDPYLNGAVDEFRVYNRALSAGEVYYLAGGR
jgi:hypothetical protein